MIPKISVVIPVYNVEHYICRCVNSILEQTYKNIEIILVDDGSTDSSGKICDDYSQRYSFVKTIHKKNMGPADSRNIGVKYSEGEYIFFLDSDDFVIKECLEILYQNIIENNADLSCGSFGFFDDVHPINEEKNYSKHCQIYSGKKACIALLYGKDFYTSSCNILIKRNIALQNLFPVGKYHEDEMTTFRYFLSALKVVKSRIITYYYYQREGSIMHSFGQPIFDEALSADYYVDVCKRIGGKVYKAALCKKYYLYINIIETYPQIKMHNKEFYDNLKTYLKHNYLYMLFDLYAPLSIKIKGLKCLIN